MSRARNIKPGFFKNDLLAECDPLARILFSGLWCEADREGRLEDRPKRIKVECLPYDDCDVDALLNQLADRGFIVRYVVDNQAYIQISGFTKHQNPHMREAASSIPVPNEHRTSTVLAPDNTGTSPADSPFPLPDSLQEACASSTDEAPTRSDPIPYQRIADLYNQTMRLLPKVAKLNASRKTLIRRAWEDGEERKSLEFWTAYFEECEASNFLNGKGPYTNGHENWRPDFDFLMQGKTVLKVYEKALTRMEQEQ